MFSLEPDLNLLFVPPMEDRGQGIILTRTIPIPIQPTSGLILCGRMLEEFGPTELGFQLDEVKWDLDREVFLATTTLTDVGLPLALIPDTVRSYIDKGWRIGSHSDTYADESEADDDDGDGMSVGTDGAATDYEQLEILQGVPQNRRPKDFNRLFKALICEMVRASNNVSAAYAMDKLRRLVELPVDRDPITPAERTPIQKRWAATVEEFAHLGSVEQWEWRERVLSTYPGIENVI